MYFINVDAAEDVLYVRA